MSAPLLTIDGDVLQPVRLSFGDFIDLPAEEQIADAREFGARREGAAVKLEALLRLAEPRAEADYLGLHADADNFHASIPLAPVRERAMVIYARDGQPLPPSSGGPLRFFIPDHAACQADEVDECANVKFVNRIELTVGKGYDNRPEDESSHEELHRKQGDDA